ncbi:putative membrane protein [Spirosoma lacussanchae]|uniref:phage holin family protein n=1 Tax=Spirosoma lacussanchae TaxID=1884249 RepID=UPI00110826D4|nr:phage holin family protein [Spirosoma lacussanchae]
MLERLEEIRENIFRYLEARIELFTLETRSKVEEGVVVGIHGIVLALLATMTTIFLFSLLAAYLNEVTNSRYLGFLIVAGFFLLMTIIWLAAKDFFKSKIRVAAYSAIKKSQEKKKEEKSEAVEELMAQTRTAIGGGGSLGENQSSPRAY